MRYTCNSCEELHEDLGQERHCDLNNPYNFGIMGPILRILEKIQKVLRSN